MTHIHSSGPHRSASNAPSPSHTAPARVQSPRTQPWSPQAFSDDGRHCIPAAEQHEPTTVERQHLGTSEHRHKPIILPFSDTYSPEARPRSPHSTPTESGLDFLLLTEASQRAEYLERNYVAAEVKDIIRDVLALGRYPIDPADISHLRTRWNELQHHTVALNHYWDTNGVRLRQALCAPKHHDTNHCYSDDVHELTAKIASAHQLGISVNDAWRQWLSPDEVPPHRRARFFEPEEGRNNFHPTSARYYFEPTISELMRGPSQQLFHHSIDLFIFRTTYEHSSGQRFCTYSVYSDYNWQQQYVTGQQPQITEQFDSAQEFPCLADALDYLRDALFFGNFSHPTA